MKKAASEIKKLHRGVHEEFVYDYFIKDHLNAQKAEFRLNAKVAETEVSKWDQMNMRLKGRSHYANHNLNDIDQKFQQFLILNSSKLNRYTAKHSERN
jgi:hypothetical protein